MHSLRAARLPYTRARVQPWRHRKEIPEVQGSKARRPWPKCQRYHTPGAAIEQKMEWRDRDVVGKIAREFGPPPPHLFSFSILVPPKIPREPQQSKSFRLALPPAVRRHTRSGAFGTFICPPTRTSTTGRSRKQSTEKPGWCRRYLDYVGIHKRPCWRNS